MPPSEGFLGYINRALEEQSCKRQYRYRLRENRAALLCQYQTLAHALSRQERGGGEAPRFIPELCCRSAGKGGAPLSGDQVAGFQQGKWYYLLLCDGMGAGRAARAEASAAIALIRQLLQTGSTAAEALTLLNSVYLLRDDGAFATVDLLQADLTSGQASLYKWGGAPSYLKRKNQVEKIGTASPPPGIGVGEAHHPEEAKLSLAKGELLVLMSDGAGGEAAERMIASTAATRPKSWPPASSAAARPKAGRMIAPRRCWRCGGISRSRIGTFSEAGAYPVRWRYHTISPWQCLSNCARAESFQHFFADISTASPRRQGAALRNSDNMLKGARCRLEKSATGPETVKKLW